MAVYGAIGLANASTADAPLIPLTNQDYINSQQAAIAAGASNVQSAGNSGLIARIDYPSLNDIGVGKMQIGTAMNAVNTYANEVTSGTITGDPLNLLQYVGNTPLLVQNLINPNTTMRTTISLSAVMAQQANAWGQSHIATWSSYSDDQKAEFSSAFYTRGQAAFDNSYNYTLASGVPYVPNLQASDGAAYFSATIPGAPTNIDALNGAVQGGLAAQTQNPGIALLDDSLSQIAATLASFQGAPAGLAFSPNLGGSASFTGSIGSGAVSGSIAFDLAGNPTVTWSGASQSGSLVVSFANSGAPVFNFSAVSSGQSIIQTGTLYESSEGNIEQTFVGYTGGSARPYVQAFSESLSTGEVAASLQIDLAAGSSPHTTLLAENSEGNSQTLDLSGIATVSNAFFNANNAATVSGTGPNILIGGDNSTLTDTNPGGIFINLGGTGGSATTGSNARVIDFGNTFTINNQGTACTDGIHCNDVTVNGTGETVNDDSGSGVTVNGNNNTIASGDTATVDAIGNNNTVTGGANDTDTGTDDTDTLGAGSTVTDTAAYSDLTVNGGSVSIGLAATNQTLMSSGDTVSVAPGDYAVINGNSDTDYLGAGSSAPATGTNLTLDGSLDLIGLGTATSASIIGNGDTVGLNGIGDTLTASNDSISVANGDYAVVDGSADGIYAGTGSSLYLTGTGDGITASDDQIGLGAARRGRRSQAPATRPPRARTPRPASAAARASRKPPTLRTATH